VSDKRVFYFNNPTARRLARAQCDLAPDGCKVVFDYEPPKTRPQEQKFHAMIGDIARSCVFLGQKFDTEEWKRLLIDAFARVMREQARLDGRPDPFGDYGRVVPSLDGIGIVQLGIQSRKFSKPLAMQFIEYLYAWGAENNVVWSGEVDWS